MNAAIVARVCVIIALAASGDAAEVHLRKPAPAVAAPPAAQPAAPEVLKAHAAAPETDVVRRAATAASKILDKQTLVGSSPRVAQAKQIVAQLHAAPPKAAPAPVKAASNTAPKDGLVWPSMPRRGESEVVFNELEAELKEAEEQAHNKMNQLKLQAGLEKEKEVEAAKAQKDAIDLRARAKQLRSQAEAAAQIAKEKSDAASKAEKDMTSTASKVTNLLAEETEMQRVLNQTQKEELALEHNISSLKVEEAKAKGVATALVVEQTHTVAVAPKAAPALNQEAMQNLMEENKRLKHDKAELERQLSDRKVAKEKSKLKQKLKNRLALADRHMKLRKQRVSPHPAHA